MVKQMSKIEESVNKVYGTFPNRNDIPVAFVVASVMKDIEVSPQEYKVVKQQVNKFLLDNREKYSNIEF
jgi:hypothetical protein